MRTVILLLIMTAMLLGGCVYRRSITADMPPDSLAKLNAECGKFAGRAVFQDEHQVNASRFRFQMDSLFCTTGHGAHPKVFANSDLDHVTLLDHSGGAVDGLEYGAIAGAVAGGVVGFIYGILAQHTKTVYSSLPPDSSGHVVWKSARENEPTNPILTMLYGAGIGGVAGGAVGVTMGFMGGRIVEVKYRFPVKSKL